MQELSTLADVVSASGADPQCLWAAQGLADGGRAWEHAGALAVACRELCGRDRIVVRGPAAAASRLVREAIDALGPTFIAVGDPPVMEYLLDQLDWLQPNGYFGWMDGTKRPRFRPAHPVRWLARREWQAADDVVSLAAPDSYARPWLPGVRRWAGISDDLGQLTCTVADAWSTPGLGFLAGLAVLPEARRSGQGRDVCGFVLDALLAAHGRAALMVRDWNAAAVSLYSQLGMSYRHQQVLCVRPAAGG
jgi:ribosomal protein S18 acetylase RimI-like enzyme